MSAPEVIRRSCEEIREQARAMAEEGRMLRAEVAAARREGYEKGYADGMADGAALERANARARERGRA